jgi:adenylate cyclase
VQREQARVLVFFAVVLGAGLAAQYAGLAERADRALLDAEFRLLRERRPQPVEKDVVLVGIDETTFQVLREPFALWHPHLGRFLQAMALAKPSVVGLDIVLPDRSYHFLIPDYDQPLVRGLAELRGEARVPIALAQSLDERGNLRAIFPPYLAAAGNDALGSVAVCRDPDLAIRRFDETSCDESGPQPTLAGRMAQHLGVKQEWRGLINYAIGDPVGYLPLQQVLQWIEQGQSSRLAETFRGRPVLVGVILPFSDRYPLPAELAAFEPKSRMLPGVLVHVQALRSMLQRGFVQPLPAWLVLLASAAAMLAWFGRSGWAKAALLALGALGVFGAALLLLWQGSYLPAAGIVLCALYAALARLTYDAALQGRERRFLTGAFSSYVSPQFLKEILAGRIQPGLAGVRRRICVMFCDIHGFTSRAEKMAPEQVISLLNRYFTAATAAIYKRGGTTNKFLGDGVMALFGAPQPLECPEKNALEAAQDILSALRELDRELAAEGIEPLKIGIGLHAGEVVLGHVGGRLHREYSAIGEVVNLASRLEAMTRELDYPVVCSAAVADAVGRAGDLRDLGERAPRGHPALRVFGWNPPVLAAQAQMKPAEHR